MTLRAILLLFAVYIFTLAIGMEIGKESKVEPIGYCQYIWYYPDNVTVAVNMNDGEVYRKTVQANGLHHDLMECK